MCDREGNYWIGTYGGGLSSLIRDYFVFYNLNEIGFKNNKVHSVIKTDGELWMGLENGLMKCDPYCFENNEFYDKALGIPNDLIRGFYLQENKVLWVATSKNGLYYREPGQLNFTSYSYTKSLLGNQINDIDGNDNILYLATQGGLYIIELDSKKINHLTTIDGLPHNNINFIFRDKNGHIWIGPKDSGITKIDSSKIEVHRLSQRPVNIADMTEDNNGDYWLATVTKGILKYTEDTLLNITLQDGLLKDYCYSIESDKKNRLWICHHPGLSCLDLNNMQIRTFGYENNMGGEFNQVWKDENETLWFASSEGIINYFPEDDKPNMIPPLLNFTSILVSGKSYELNKPITLPYPYGKKHYKFRFDFTGISFENPGDVTYEYMMEKKGSDESMDWVKLNQTNFREYEFLPDGEYLLKIRAYNADGIATISPISVYITIDQPFWKKIWFLFVSFLLFIFWDISVN